jgi:hypothetical protein
MAACVLVFGERFACGSTVVSTILQEESLSERLIFFFSNLSLFRASVDMVAMLLVLYNVLLCVLLNKLVSSGSVGEGRKGK